MVGVLVGLDPGQMRRGPFRSASCGRGRTWSSSTQGTPAGVKLERRPGGGGLVQRGDGDGGRQVVGAPSTNSKVSGVPQASQKPRRTLLELWKRLALAARPGQAVAPST